jgi:hypothetical protein
MERNGGIKMETSKLFVFIFLFAKILVMSVVIGSGWFKGLNYDTRENSEHMQCLLWYEYCSLYHSLCNMLVEVKLF